MPELPEVQNTVDGIRERTLGRTILEVWTNYDSPVYYGKKNIKDPRYFTEFRSKVIGQQIVGVERRAKQIFIHLSNETSIAVHMKMTGHFLVGSWDWNALEQKWQPPAGFWNKSWNLSKEEVRKTMPFSDPFNDFIHLMFNLDQDLQLAFSDMRKFGTIVLLENREEYAQTIAHYGPEPLEPDLSFDQFMSKLKTRPHKQVKTALLDQSLIAGFGNIYSDEVLFAARVHPESFVSKIPKQQWYDIYTYGRDILRAAIRHGGDSMGDYRRVDGTGGTYQGLHQVYQRENQACRRCGKMIEKKQIGARIGRYCPGCQICY